MSMPNDRDFLLTTYSLQLRKEGIEDEELNAKIKEFKAFLDRARSGNVLFFLIEMNRL